MITRRKFLAGLGGATVALPFLESVRFFGGRGRSQAAGTERPVYAFFMKQNNGVAQYNRWNMEPEMFWPHEYGQLTQELLSTRDADRAISELAPFADQLLLVGQNHRGYANETGCGHADGSMACLTAARPGTSGSESVDWRLGTHCNPPGVEPLNLVSGPTDSSSISYRGPGQLRGAENDPWVVYQKLMGLAETDPAIVEAIRQRRMSVNDLVRDELQDLLTSSQLSGGDRERLELHLDSVRDLELGMACELDDALAAEVEGLSGEHEINDNRVRASELLIDVVALTFACDANRVAVLQIGPGSTRFYLDGVQQESYHYISHRVQSDGTDGDPIPGAQQKHHEIDRIHARLFARMLERLSTYAGPGGGSLLDDSFALWTNELRNGDHDWENLPQVLAGSAGGFLKTGVYLDTGGTNVKQLHTTLLAAAGVRNASGDYVDDFGDPDLPGGIIPGMLA